MHVVVKLRMELTAPLNNFALVHRMLSSSLHRIAILGVMHWELGIASIRRPGAEMWMSRLVHTCKRSIVHKVECHKTFAIRHRMLPSSFASR